MISKVRRLVNDVHSQEFEDADIKDALADALENYAADLFGHNDGKRALLRYSSEFSFVADQEEYALPGDIMAVQRVEVLPDSNTSRWANVQKKNIDEYSADRLLSGFALEESSYAVGTTGLYWFDDVEEGNIRFYPAFASVNEEKYRFRYYAWPTMVDDDDGTLLNPHNDSTDTSKLPVRSDMAVEYYAAATLSFEELEDGKPIGAFGQAYANLLASICRTTARGATKSTRRYVRRTRRA